MKGESMEKTQARKQLDKYIDICLDCDGIQTEEKNCHNCSTHFNTIKVGEEIRKERKEKRSDKGAT